MPTFVYCKAAQFGLIFEQKFYGAALKIQEIQHLGDLFRFDKENIIDDEQATEYVNQLLDVALIESDEKIIEEIIDTFFLITERRYVKANWIKLSKLLPSRKIQGQIIMIISLLGNSCDNSMIPILDTYLQHHDPEVQKTAQETIEEINKLCDS
ncbi:MAG: hypothetical protein LBI18_06010 [Planctomycetaceae bacterium]|nr:hypothetical protein [Planctomycetaceae bacterium]